MNLRYLVAGTVITLFSIFIYKMYGDYNTTMYWTIGTILCYMLFYYGYYYVNWDNVLEDEDDKKQ